MLYNLTVEEASVKYVVVVQLLKKVGVKCVIVKVCRVRSRIKIMVDCASQVRHDGKSLRVLTQDWPKANILRPCVGWLSLEVWGVVRTYLI